MFTIEINQSELTERMREADGDTLTIETKLRAEPENLILPIAVRLEINLDEV